MSDGDVRNEYGYGVFDRGGISDGDKLVRIIRNPDRISLMKPISAFTDNNDFRNGLAQKCVNIMTEIDYRSPVVAASRYEPAYH